MRDETAMCIDAKTGSGKSGRAARGIRQASRSRTTEWIIRPATNSTAIGTTEPREIAAHAIRVVTIQTAAVAITRAAIEAEDSVAADFAEAGSVAADADASVNTS